MNVLIIHDLLNFRAPLGNFIILSFFFFNKDTEMLEWFQK